MRKYILWFIVLLMVICAVIIVCKSINRPDIKILEIGNFIVLSLTLVALIFYAHDTYRLASIGQSKWEKENILNATYEMVGINDLGGAGRILFRITNPSTLIIRAKVWAEFKVYGVPVDPGGDFNGTKIWLVFPQQTSQGWYEISSLIAQQGKTPQKMQSEYDSNNRTTQLTLDLTIEFRDELGNERKLPTRKHYFAFNDWTWIPVLIGSNGWET
jgi:hypothetical protein